MDVGRSPLVKGALLNSDCWRGRRVLLTGHTGFKGAWACALLQRLGAEISGLSLLPDSVPSLWGLIGGRLQVKSNIVDLRDLNAVTDVCENCQPEIVIHMAAQAQVKRSFANPAETYASNVMGTVNLLEGLRRISSLKLILVITSDKVYLNEGRSEPFHETNRLGGSDPYSASKAATEIVVRSYAESFFEALQVPLVTARGGNVLGGGDFSSDRLVPDVVRAALNGQPVELRYPDARRPWQHVLDCVSGYIRYAEYLCLAQAAVPPALNFGPHPGQDLTVAEVADSVGRRLGNAHPWVNATGYSPPEKQFLRLDNSLAAKTLNWHPKLAVQDTLSWTAEWYSAYANGGDPLDLVNSQIETYCKVKATSSHAVPPTNA